MNLFWMIFLQVVLIALNAVFACAEIAVLGVSESKLKKLAEGDNPRAKRLLRLTSQPARFLATIQVAITLAGFLGAAFAADNFAGYIIDLFAGWGIKLPEAVVIIVITLLLSYVTLIFGELVPKRIAMRQSEKIALGLSAPLAFVAFLFMPFVWVLTVSTNGVLRLCGIDPNQNDEEVSEEDVILMVDAGNQSGTIDSMEHEIIQNVFGFDDLSAGEVATHRTDVAMLWTEDDEDVWDSIVHQNRFTFYPVCHETPDNIVGVLNAKDYFRLEEGERTREAVMAKAVSPAYLVPEGVKADVLFRNMKTDHHKFAIVIDEYGGMLGIITMMDLLERLVGDISNDDAAQPGSDRDDSIHALEDGSFRVPGTAPLAEVEKELGVSLPTEEFDTFGGMVFAAMGAIPADGTEGEIDVEGLHVKICKVAEHQLEEAIVSVIPPEEESEEKDEE